MDAALLQAIQKGKGLKKVPDSQKNDRSSALAGKVSGSPGGGGGAGGMGTVYTVRNKNAEFASLVGERALKLIHPHIAQKPSFKKRFLVESLNVQCYSISVLQTRGLIDWAEGSPIHA